MQNPGSAPTPPSPPAPAIDADRACALLHEVCHLAATAIGVARPRPDVHLDEDDLLSRVQMLRQTLDRVGWVADVALRALGDAGSFAGPEDWMLATLAPR